MAGAKTGLALDPESILVVANRKAGRSVGLAEYYMDKRNIPKDNLLQVWITDSEKCSREEYDKQLVKPVRRELKNRQDIRCLVLIYGLPLKVAGPPLSKQEKKRMRELKQNRERLKNKMEDSGDEGQARLKKKLQQLKKKIRKEKNRRNRSSSVDSELALVQAGDYSLSKWQPNPYFVGFRDKELSLGKEDVLLVARLDGPDSDTVKRIIRDSIKAEENGLTGRACFDARWPEPEEDQKSGYTFYDWSIHKAAERVEKSGELRVKVNDSGELFQPGECPEAALYCGWYKLAHYVDAFEWQTGAVGYHIASQECQSLKRGEYWCKRMLEEGVAATIGPVEEPYVQSFPVPEVFFQALLDGRYTLGEAYLLANPFWSWKMVLVGDPLYSPFGE
ncbi:MAG: TIGR03790 family protein [Desulfohalobiaceae bacterium]